MSASGEQQTVRRRWMSHFCEILSRSKPLDHDSMMETPLNRNLTQLDVLMYGVGAMLGNSIYGVMAVVAHNFAGPATFLCFLLAGFVAFLNGMCYSELSAHIPRAGSAYVYTYVIAGEFLAFLTGWLMLLEYAMTACSAAVAAAYNIDILANNTISIGILTHVGELSTSDSGLINRYPNLLAFGIIVLALLVLATGNRSTSIINVVLSLVTLIVISMATVFMYCHFDKHNFLSAARHSFFPYGASGFLSGTGIAFNAFIGFDAISVAGEEAKNPRKSIPIGIVTGVTIVIVVTVVHAIASIGYTPWWTVHPQLGLANVFFSPPVVWLRIIVGVGAVLASIFAVICCCYAIPRIAYSMATDGLLFSAMGWIEPTVKVPLLPLFLFGGLTAIISVFFNYTSLVSFLSVGTLISYTIVACDLVILRFMKSELYLIKDPNEVGFLYQQFRRLKFIDSPSRGLVPCWALLCFVIVSAALVLFSVETSKYIFHGYGWAISILVMLVLVLTVCVVIIALHRPYEGSGSKMETFQVPLFPYVPLLSVFFNIALIVKLPVLTWVRVGIWIAIGLIVYFGYGIRFSKLSGRTIHLPGDYEEIPDSTGKSGGKRLISFTVPGSSSMKAPTPSPPVIEDEKAPIIAESDLKSK